MEISTTFIKRDFYLVDFSYLLYKYHYRLQHLSAVVDGKEIKTGAFYGTIKRLLSLVDKNPLCNVYLCEEGFPQDKREALPEYKSDRNIIAFGRIKEDVRDVLLSLPNFYSVGNPDYEADDIISILCHSLHEDHNKIILSKDDDFLQLLTIPNTFLMSSTDELRGSRYVLDKYKVPLDEILLYRILKGDNTDKIPAIGGIKAPRARELTAKYKNYSALIADLDNIPELKAHKTDLERNYYLTRLKDDTHFHDCVVNNMTTSTRVAMDTIVKYKCFSLTKFYSDIVLKLKSI